MAKKTPTQVKALLNAVSLRSCFENLPGPHSRWFHVDVWINQRWECNLTTVNLDNAFQHFAEFRLRYECVRMLDQFGNILALMAGTSAARLPQADQLADLNQVDAHVEAMLIDLEQEEV